MFQCVYSIQCLDENIKEFYIGSTDNLQQRIYKHKSNYNCGTNYKVYKFIRENGGMSNWEINYIQKFKFLTKEELLEYEQWYIDTYKPELNSYSAFRTEYEKLNQDKINYEKHKEQKLLQKKEYYQKNKEILNEKGNCPHCNLEMLKRSIKRHIKRKHPTASELG